MIAGPKPAPAVSSSLADPDAVVAVLDRVTALAWSDDPPESTAMTSANAVAMNNIFDLHLISTVTNTWEMYQLRSAVYPDRNRRGSSAPGCNLIWHLQPRQSDVSGSPGP